MKIGISGPMSMYKDTDWNFPAFFDAEARIREAVGPDHEVVNPAALHEHTDRPWKFYIRESIYALMDCDVIVLLPKWDRSKGARLEFDTCYGVGIRGYNLQTFLEHHAQIFKDISSESSQEN